MTVLPAITEKDFQQQVLDLAALHRWLAYHTHDSRRSGPGFPDLVLVRAPELIVAELKTETGRLRPSQTRWLDALRSVAGEITFALDVAREADARLRAAGLELSSEAQVDRLACIEVHVWRPSDFDAIHARLRTPLRALPSSKEAA